MKPNNKFLVRFVCWCLHLMNTSNLSSKQLESKAGSGRERVTSRYCSVSFYILQSVKWLTGRLGGPSTSFVEFIFVLKQTDRYFSCEACLSQRASGHCPLLLAIYTKTFRFFPPNRNIETFESQLTQQYWPYNPINVSGDTNWREIW